MIITTALANEIVARAMAIIHHNVNVIDHHGQIIASGERHRIGEQHEVAREVIRTGKRICINNAAEAARFHNVHPGINHPIIYDDRVVMVVGISGDPAAISRYAELAVLTAELLVRQAIEMRETNWRQRLRDTLFCQYLEQGATPAGQEALHRLLELGFDFDTPRVPIVVTVQVEQHQLSDILSTLLREFSQLSGVSDVILLGSHEILILNALSEAQETLLRGIEFVLSNQISHYYIGIGVQADSAPDIREAIRFARSVIEVGSKVQPQRQIYYFREMAMLCLFRVLEDSYMVNFFINNVRQLLEHDSGEVLLDTLSSFIANNAEPGKTSLLLGIHRNTLTYRLQQIKKHIQLDPMVFIWQLLAGPALAQIVRRLWLMMTGIIIGTLAGSSLLIGLNPRWSALALGAALIVYAGYALCSPVFQVSGRVEKWLSPLMGGLTGVITGATGVFVIPAVPWLQALGFRRDELVQALGLSFTLSTLALAAGLALHDGWHDDAWLLSALALLPALLGMWLGQRIRSRLSPQRFRQGFLLFLLALGIELIARGWLV